MRRWLRLPLLSGREGSLFALLGFLIFALLLSTSTVESQSLAAATPVPPNFAGVTKSAAQASSHPGGVIDYTTVVTLGSARGNVVVEDLFLYGLDYVPGSARVGGVPFEPVKTVQQLGRIVYEFRLGDLQAGSTVLTYQGIVDPNKQCQGQKVRNSTKLYVGGGWAGESNVETPLTCLTPTAGPSSTPTPTLSPGGGTPTSTPTATPISGAFTPRVEEVASGLYIPWQLVFAPDGRLFFTERNGKLRVMVNGQLLATPVATLPIAGSTLEGGLLGLALDPAFADNGYLYLFYTFSDSVGGLRHRISRLTVGGNLAGNEQVLLDGIPAGYSHNGGRMKFGPDGKLYATTGDIGLPELGQDLNSLAGKILRLNSDGTIPADNPFPGSPIYTLGHRNAQGLAFEPGTGRLFATEHGPGGGWDEVNIIEKGQNYGWPVVAGIANDPRFVDPIIDYVPSIAPSGATFYTGDQLGPWKGSLFFTTLTGTEGQHLHRMRVGGPSGREVLEEEILFEGAIGIGYGRLRDVVQGPDGYLYISTSNWGGDRILRIVPE